jgi:hypothetical protein
MGIVPLTFPMRIRSVAAAKTWQDDSDRAERYQCVFAYVVGTTVGGFGLGTVALGLVSG